MIYDTIRQDFLTSRRERNAPKSAFLSFVIGQIQNAQNVSVDKDGNKVYDDDLVLSVIKNLDKKLKENPNPNQTEDDILSVYLPKMLSEDDLRQILSDVDGGMKEKMSFLKENYAFQYDGKIAAMVAKE